MVQNIRWSSRRNLAGVEEMSHSDTMSHWAWHSLSQIKSSHLPSTVLLLSHSNPGQVQQFVLFQLTLVPWAWWEKSHPTWHIGDPLNSWSLTSNGPSGSTQPGYDAFLMWVLPSSPQKQFHISCSSPSAGNYLRSGCSSKNTIVWLT